MFVLILVFSQVGCEWVEISQNHYRKEPAHKVANFEFPTTPNSVYKNNSAKEKQWQRGVVDKVSSVANVRRVQNPSVKTSSVQMGHEYKRYNNNYNDHTDATEADGNGFLSVNPNRILNEVVENVNKVTDRTIWTMTAAVDHVKRPNSEPTTSLPSAGINNLDYKQTFFQKQSVSNNYVTNNKKQAQISKPLLSETNKNVDKLDYNDKNKSYLDRLSHNHEVPNGTSSNLFGEYIQSRNKFKNTFTRIDGIDFIDEFPEKTIVVDTNLSKPVQNNNVDITASIGKGTKIPKEEDTRPKDVSNLTKADTVKSLWKLMKLVADTIYKNTHRSFRSKVTYLEGLKSSVLWSIEEQIDRAWPDDARAGGAGGARRARSAAARAHVEFPSSESTLMTISFLTFAVFLIKLVLQVINTYKNKTMMVAPAIVAAVGRAAAALKSAK